VRSVNHPARETSLTDQLASRAIESGANVLAEGFLFSVAAALIIGETWRSSRSQSKQRSGVNESIERLRIQVRELDGRLQISEEAVAEEQRRCVTPPVDAWPF
jgi:hypothetical protein